LKIFGGFIEVVVGDTIGDHNSLKPSLGDIGDLV